MFLYSQGNFLSRVSEPSLFLWIRGQNNHPFTVSEKSGNYFVILGSTLFAIRLSIYRVCLLTRSETSHGDTEDTEQVANPEEIDIDEDEDDNDEGTLSASFSNHILRNKFDRLSTIEAMSLKFIVRDMLASVLPGCSL